MTVPYFGRLLCLCFAAFFLLNLGFTAIVAAIAGRAVRRAGRMSAGGGARLLFALRIFPAAAASAVVAGLCVPSYLQFEPDNATEQIGAVCLAAAALGAWSWGAGILRGELAIIRSARYRSTSEGACESGAPILMLAGVFRPRLIVSRGMRETLTPEQLAVAVRHEEGHQEARDNLKRLLILLSPDAVPFARTLRGLERAWARMAEWAADDRAVQGDRRQAVALAEALVRVARMGGAPTTDALATHLFGNHADLAARVERLVDSRPSAVEPRLWPVFALIACGAAATLQPATLASIHEALEALAH